MVGLVSAILVSHLAGRKLETRIIPLLILTVFVLPYILYWAMGTALVTYEPIDDWGGTGAFGMGSPTFFPLIGIIAGSFLGAYSGLVWSNDGEKSCFACLMLPVTIVFALSLVLLII
jgi:hypothetical protein